MESMIMTLGTKRTAYCVSILGDFGRPVFWAEGTDLQRARNTSWRDLITASGAVRINLAIK